MPLEAHYDRFVLRCGSCGEELTKPGPMAPLPEAAAAGWGLIVEPNGTYDYACSACLAKPRIERTQARMKRQVQAATAWPQGATKLVSQRVIDFDQN
jgi:hypothetical protein